MWGAGVRILKRIAVLEMIVKLVGWLCLANVVLLVFAAIRIEDIYGGTTGSLYWQLAAMSVAPYIGIRIYPMTREIHPFGLPVVEWFCYLLLLTFSLLILGTYFTEAVPLMFP